MAVATSTDQSIVEIPFLIRGRVVEPGDDVVEYSGRAGARFRTPDPIKLASELVLTDPRDLRDLRETPIDEIIDFLVELGPTLRLDENREIQKAFQLALEAGELTEPLLRTVYDDFLNWFTPDRLNGLVATVGKEFLDGWVELGAPGRSSMRMRAIGTRQLHIIAGNVPVTTAMTVVRCALTKSDCLIKMPSNDPYTAAAVVRSMIDLDPSHPLTRHFAVAYWKGGDEGVESQIIRPSRIEKLSAWGGMASMRHIQKYLVPGIELIAFNPKSSISIVGHEALESDSAMQETAQGIATASGAKNQTGCSCTRIVYVECSRSEEDLERLEQLGHAIYRAFGDLPEWFSTAPKRSDPALDAELDAVAVQDDFFRVIGESSFGGAVVSLTEEPVEFASILNNRIVNLVPVSDITDIGRWVNGDETQTVSVSPERLRTQLRDELAASGVQVIKPLKRVGRAHGATSDPAGADPGQRYHGVHDGTEPMRRMVRWVTDESIELS